MENGQNDKLIAHIKADLREAMKNRRQVEVSAIRSLLARVSNAEAVPAPSQKQPTANHIAGASSGVGSTEAPRRQLAYSDLQAVIRDEIREIVEARQSLAETSSYALELDQKIRVLKTYQ